MPNNIYLVGPMGAGKSSIGKRLAKRIEREFYDSDRVLEERTGVAITTIFELEGELGFRNRETNILKDLVQLDNAVIATGGGVILRETNRKLMKSSGTIVFLQTSIDTQLKRTRHDKKRPLLQTGNRRAKLMALAKERDPVYEDLADITICTNSQSISSSVSQIIKQLT